jgi:ABC-2 type transport system ATP-binding protein
MFKIITGQLKPGLGHVKVFNQPIWNNSKLWNKIGYCPEYDNFWSEMTGFEFVLFLAKLHGIPTAKAENQTKSALNLVGMLKESNREIAGYSKGMRQRIKIAQALVHDPELLILDEPLSGTDPIMKYNLVNLFHNLEAAGKTLVISSHVLEEMERITDNMIRDLIDRYPHNIYFSTPDFVKLARRLVDEDFVLSVTKHEAQSGLTVQTHQPDRFYSEIARIIRDEHVEISQMTSTDDNLDAVFRYLIE